MGLTARERDATVRLYELGLFDYNNELADVTNVGQLICEILRLGGAVPDQDKDDDDAIATLDPNSSPPTGCSAPNCSAGRG